MHRPWLVQIVGGAGLVAAAWWAWTAAEDAGWFDAKAVPVPDDVARAMLRDVRRWDAATSGERRGVAERVAARLDAEKAGFTLLRVRPFGFEGHRHEIAVFRHETTGLEFSLIPGGTFTMGSPETEAERFDDETRREVTLSGAFLLARTECTQEAYGRVTGAKPSLVAGPDRPVENVSWDEATAFCAKAGLRLPAEAEWEFACRAGTTTAYWPGDAEADLAHVGWYDGNLDPMTAPLRWALGKLGRQPPPPATRVVGLLPANPFGLHDVHGNVWEWCADACADVAGGDETGEADGTPPGAAPERVLRGGSWLNPAGNARSAHRSGEEPALRNGDVGFRPARSVPPAHAQ